MRSCFLQQRRGFFHPHFSVIGFRPGGRQFAAADEKGPIYDISFSTLFFNLYDVFEGLRHVPDDRSPKAADDRLALPLSA